MLWELIKTYQRDGSFEHMFKLMGYKIITILRSSNFLIWIDKGAIECLLEDWSDCVGAHVDMSI